MSAAEKRGWLELGAGPVAQVLGRVLDAEPGLRVMADDGPHHAQRAVSCLVAPKAHDLVLLARPARGPLYVLGVLERHDHDEPVPVSVGEDVRVEVKGNLDVAARGRLELRSLEELALGATRVTVRALESRLASQTVEVAANVAELRAQAAKVVADSIDTVVDRLLTRADRAYRFVTELDVVRSKEMDRRASSTMNLRAENTFLTSDELVKVQGDQIHLG
jgi:hypothetical protein